MAGRVVGPSLAGRTNMNARLIIAAMLILAGSGCATLIEKRYGPAGNESTYNMLRAAMYLGILKDRGDIPELTPEQHGKTQAYSSLLASRTVEYPSQVQVVMTLDDEPEHRYRYDVHMQTAESDLVITNAWKSDKAGNVVLQRLFIPTNNQQQRANEELRNYDDIRDLEVRLNGARPAPPGNAR